MDYFIKSMVQCTNFVPITGKLIVQKGKLLVSGNLNFSYFMSLLFFVLIFIPQFSDKHTGCK